MRQRINKYNSKIALKERNYIVFYIVRDNNGILKQEGSTMIRLSKNACANMKQFTECVREFKQDIAISDLLFITSFVEITKRDCF